MLTWQRVVNGISTSDASLNPYSNGMLTWLNFGAVQKKTQRSLNPYSNGMLTWEVTAYNPDHQRADVLILILMECSLGVIVRLEMKIAIWS